MAEPEQSQDGMGRRAVLLGAAAGVVLAHPAQARGIDRSRSLVIAVPADPASIDPAINRAEPIGSEVILNVFDTLVSFAPPDFQQPVGRLAESWSVSTDGCRYVFRLRPGILFHDSTALDAEAVIFSFERTRALNPYMQASFAPITAITADDAATVTIVLQHPVPFLLSLLAQPQAAIVSPASVRLLRAGAGQAPVGTGAFRFHSRDPDTSLVLQANPHYFRGVSALEYLIYQVIADASTRRLLLENGDIDISQQSGQLASLPMEDVRAFRANPRLQVIEAPSQIMRQLEFNNRSTSSAARDIRVRQAMACAVDYRGLIEGVLAGTVDRAYGPLPTSNADFDPSLVHSAVTYDPAQARALLNQAGFPSHALRFTLYTFQGSLWATVATFLQANFAAVGIDLRIEQIEFPSFRALHVGGHFDIALDGREPWYEDPDAHLTIGYLSSLGATAMTYRMPPDAGLDALILQAQTCTDPARRRALYVQIQQSLVARIPALYLFTNKVIIFAQAAVAGLVVRGTPPLTEYWSVHKRTTAA